jgi:hypothetical protein
LIGLFAIEQMIQANVAFFRTNPTAGNFLLGGVILGGTLLSVLRQPATLRVFADWSLSGFAIILLWSATSLFWTRNYEFGSTFVRWGVPYAIVYVVLGPLLTYESKSLRRGFVAVMWLCIPVTVLLLASDVTSVRGGRLAVKVDVGTFTSVLNLGEFGGIVMIVAALIRKATSQSVELPLRLAAFVSGAALCVLSGSRGQFAFSVLSILAFLPFTGSRVTFRTLLLSTVGGVFVIILAWVVFTFALSDTDPTRWTADKIQGGFMVRLFNVLDLLGAFASSPIAWIIGLGTGSFATISTSGEPYTHNIPLDVLCEQGIPMFILYSAIALRTIRSIRQGLSQRVGVAGESRADLAILSALSMFYGFIILKQGTLWSTGVIAAFYWISVNALVGNMRESSGEFSGPESTGSNR